MKRDLCLVGQQLTITAPDDDVYLATMLPNGPSDLEHIFTLFCKGGYNVIDVGANIGITAAIAGILVSPGSVLALEPVAEAFGYLADNIERAALRNVKCLNVAAASTEGRVNLISNPGHNFAAFVGYENVLERYPGYAEELVMALTLDQLATDHDLSRIDFIKIDVEGYELEVLRGAKRLLQQFQPIVFLEVNHYCLNVFRKISIVDFIEEVLSIFPCVYAVDTTLEVLDLTDYTTHSGFFHENVVRSRFPNLLCGFTPDVMRSMDSLRPIVSSDTGQLVPTAIPQPLTSGSFGTKRRLASRLRSILTRP